MSQYQSRYIAYAKAHGKTPEEMDKGEKNNIAFIEWITGKWHKYDMLHPELYGVHNGEAHVQFDDVLNREVI